VSVIDSSVGVDPGPTTGLCLLEHCEGGLVGRTVLQAEGSTAVHVLKAMLAAYPVNGRRNGSVERWVDGPPAGRTGGARVTRQLEAQVVEVLLEFGYGVRVRPAADVKNWASNRCLAAALDLEEKDLTDDLRHGWDGARHCVYGAHDAGIIRHPLLGKRRAT
jgi:hypothetical protein